MDLTRHPDLLDRIAAAYALGTLRGGARRRFEAMGRQSATVRAAALLWQERFASLTELQLSQAPSPNVWKRIENLIERPAAPPATARSPWWGGLNFWRGTGVIGSAIALAIMVVTVNMNRELAAKDRELAELQLRGRQLAQQNTQLAAQLQAQPEIRYVAVLADDKAGASMLALFDPKHNTLTLKRVGDYREAADKSLQLWALPRDSAPRSIGVLGAEPVVKLAAVENQLQTSPALAISLEPKGGVPSETGPTGPVLFKGAVLQAPL
ncbi:anti-sigma factor [Ramlibacter albus]|uniref:Anti-sigma factor n=1 Tax=Ramlibacter albus TaxID=2079448 RepID=A0A923MBI4_9BURK|nr:anti-sigma factor [Ramlibacter albus]MBC5767343.1 anti-sigma factor [Ramlibacter albus]